MHAHSNDFIRLILKVFSMNSIKRHSRQKLKFGLNYTILELINVCMPTQMISFACVLLEQSTTKYF